MIKKLLLFSIFTFQSAYAMPIDGSSLRNQISNYSYQLNAKTSLIEIESSIREMALNAGFAFSGDPNSDLQLLVDSQVLTPSEAVEIQQFIRTLENEEIDYQKATLFSMNMMYYKGKEIAGIQVLYATVFVLFWGVVFHYIEAKNKEKKAKDKEDQREEELKSFCKNASKDPAVNIEKFKILCGHL